MSTNAIFFESFYTTPLIGSFFKSSFSLNSSEISVFNLTDF